MEKVDQKSWKDRMPPDGHLPASYEVQVCDEGNKVIAVQMLDKAGVDYKISARKGQFFIQACDMKNFTQIKNVLNQSLDMNKEADKLGFKPEIAPDVTPVATNTPQADITAANVAVTEPVKEKLVDDSISLLNQAPESIRKILEKQAGWEKGISADVALQMMIEVYNTALLTEATRTAPPKKLSSEDKKILKKLKPVFDQLFRDNDTSGALVAAYKMGFDDADEEFNEPNR